MVGTSVFHEMADRVSRNLKKIGLQGKMVQAVGMRIDRSESARLTQADLLPGDHIYVKRRRGLYVHHGIYMGDGKVIHFTGSVREKKDPRVQETDLSGFLKGGILSRRDYEERLRALETVTVAKNQLSDCSYSVLWNNCEHFATYCATGKRKSWQVRKAFSGLGSVAAGFVLLVLARVVSAGARKP
jgi:hypothetical protein